MQKRTFVYAAAVALAATALTARAAAGKGSEARVKRGEFLVKLGGCNDCHTPLKMGPQGPAPDFSRMLSGHPEQLQMPPAPRLPEGPWVVTAAGSLTAWSGPWGVSFTANLTPDPETGLGRWTEQNFVQALRTGRHMGVGRPILPPMPVQSIASALGDEDLKAIFAYLRTIPPVVNHVPEPVPPLAAAAPTGAPTGAPPAAQ